MNKETWKLALLVSILLVINSSFIVILQFTKYDATPETATLGGNIVKSVLTQNNQLELFSQPILKVATSTKKSTSTSGALTTGDSGGISKKKPKQTGPSQTIPSNIRVVEGANGFKMTVDYDRDVVIFPDGREIPIIIDGDVNPSPDDYYDPTKSTSAWIQLPDVYERFNVFVEQNYYNNNSANIIDFFNKFEPRYESMEQETGWSSEEFTGQKLEIYVNGTTTDCSMGYAIPSEAHVIFSDPLYLNLSFCKKAYYETFNGTPLLGVNPGELGDFWGYMATGIHESLHAINPISIYGRSWLTEGLSNYNMRNILIDFNDINQPTADTHIFLGDINWNWTGYTNNNYRDRLGNEIQLSQGYDITAWMFSMMRDVHGLNWADFYTLIENNPETMQKVWDLRPDSVYYTDSHIIDLFGRASGLTNFETQTKPIWRYDGPSGSGWGVRNFTDLDWYADLTPLSLTYDGIYLTGNTVNLNATVRNLGGTNLQGVSVRFYVDPPGLTGLTQINEQFVNVSSLTNVNVVTSYVLSTYGNYVFYVKVDENNLKIEISDANNEIASSVLSTYVCGDVNADGASANILDLTFVVDRIFRGGPQPNPPQRGDVNADGANANILDLTYLVDRIFRGGPPAIGPVGCTPPTGSAEFTQVELDEAKALLAEVGISV